MQPPFKPCTTCGYPDTPAVALQGENRIVWVADECRDCIEAKERKAAAPPAEDFGLDEGQVSYRTKTCKVCGHSFEAVIALVLGRVLDTVTTCAGCTLKLNDDNQSAKQRAFVKGREAEWLRVCPEFYRTPEIVAAIPPEKLKAVAGAYKLGKGILVWGESGKFKTTAVFHGAIKRAIWERKSVVYVIASEWKPACSHAAKETTMLEFLRPFISADILFMDDLGNMAGTPASEEALHLLFEKRMQKRKPIIVTTQYTGTALAGRFKKTDGSDTSEMADAVIRRLGLLTGTPIKFK